MIVVALIILSTAIMLRVPFVLKEECMIVSLITLVIFFSHNKLKSACFHARSCIKVMMAEMLIFLGPVYTGNPPRT